MDLKKEAENLMKIGGNVKGEGILSDIEYVREREGEEGVKLVEEKMRELDYPLKFKEIQSFDWYPLALGVLNILVIKELFNWTDKDIFEMGMFGPKASFFIKMLLKYLVSARRAFKESPKYWAVNYDFGEFEAHEFNEKEKYITFRIKGYKFHPIMCLYIAGYILQMARYVINSKKITIKETKCIFKGDPYHEYIVNWV